MKKIVPGILMSVVLALSLEAVVPRRWELRTKEDFLRGKFDGVSLAFDGVLALAPQVDRIAGPSEEFYMSLLTGPDGELFLGTGHGGKVYRIGTDGKAELYFQTQEIDVTCLVRDGKGVLYRRDVARTARSTGSPPKERARNSSIRPRNMSGTWRSRTPGACWRRSGRTAASTRSIPRARADRSSKRRRITSSA